MGSRPRKNERWLIPRSTRHVWVLRSQRWEVPYQGYVIAWRRHSYKWAALVAYVMEDVEGKPLVQRWLPRDQLLPVRSVPDELLRNPFPDYNYGRQIGGEE